ncbi:TlpA family protein disulfide reductase [Deinococcus daejeonensis]|uniref:TlpA family protein disulfide reductase n=1 Tax=Deinococcus daejeonensis TaxID=1007098 RepID=UPI001E35E80F|nr:TlpA disulfide reductase family protein [Deinococcus daejeonensis]
MNAHSGGRRAIRASGRIISASGRGSWLHTTPSSRSRCSSLHAVLRFYRCVPCRQEAPLLRELDSRTGNDMVLLGILFQDTDKAARNFIQEFNLKYPTLRDPKLATAIDYGVAGVPETFFIDAQGIIRHVDKGGLTRERLNEGLKKVGVPEL